MVRLTDHPDMTLDVYRGRKTTMQQQLSDGYTMHIRMGSMHIIASAIEKGIFITKKKIFLNHITYSQIICSAWVFIQVFPAVFSLLVMELTENNHLFEKI